MILGLGIDILENRRMEDELSRNAWRPEDGIFTAREVGWCNSGRVPARRFAACFAAKEAATKAMGARVRDLAMFGEIEVTGTAATGQHVQFQDRMKTAAENSGVRQIKLSTTGTAGITGAIIILES
jgi:holo-[acyl-carrier protein] synthase